MFDHYKITSIYLILFLLATNCLFSQSAQDTIVDWVIPPTVSYLQVLDNKIVSFVNEEGQPYYYDIKRDSFYETSYLHITPIERIDTSKAIFYAAYVDDPDDPKKGSFLNSLHQVILDKNLKRVVKFEFSEIKFCYDNSCVARGTRGDIFIIDAANKIVIPLPKEITGFSTPDANAAFFMVSENSGKKKYSLYNYRGELIHKFEKIDRVTLNKNEQYVGLISYEGNVNNPVISTMYGETIQTSCICDSYFLDKQYVICQQGENVCFFNKKGAVKVPRNIVDIKPLNDDAVIVKDDNNRYGIMNKKGKSILPLTYDKIGVYTVNRRSAYNEYYSHADKKSKSLFFDVDMQKIHKTKYDAIGTSCKEYIAVKKNEQWGVINKKGKVIIDLQYTSLLPPSQDILYLGGYFRLNNSSFPQCPILFFSFGNSFLIGIYEGKQMHLYDGAGKKLYTRKDIKKEAEMNLLLEHAPHVKKDMFLRTSRLRFPLPILESLSQSEILTKDVDQNIFYVAKTIKYRFPAIGAINYLNEWLVLPKYQQLKYIGNNLFEATTFEFEDGTRGIIRINR